MKTSSLAPRFATVEPSQGVQATTLPGASVLTVLGGNPARPCSIYQRGAGYVSAPVVRSKMGFKEADEQASFVTWLRANHLRHHTVPNSAARSQVQGAELKRQGLVAGAPDIYVFVPGKANIAIEMKRGNGILSDVDGLQWDWHSFLPSCPGWFSCVAFGRDAAVAFVEAVMRWVDEGVPIAS